ncbi:MAG: SpoIIE family protein phosphatase [Bacteroidota bacterium]
MISMLALSAYFVYNDYENILEAKKQETLNQLEGIAKTLSLAVDPEDYQDLLISYPSRDAISKSDQDGKYHSINQLFQNALDINGLKTPIYTLTYNEPRESFDFIVTSSETPYFRHEYDTYPAVLKANYQMGGVIPPYQDDHGTWLSAFHPIKTPAGEVLGVVQVDRFYEDFQKEAYAILKQDLMVSGLAFVFVMGLMFTAINRMMKGEKRFVDDLESEVDKRTNEVIEQKEEIQSLLYDTQEKNEELVAAEEELRQQSEQLMAINETLETAHHEILVKTTKLQDSLQYARRIQSTILPPGKLFFETLPDHFVFYRPRDVVSGDFYWTHTVRQRTIIAAVDCTGHGVPGAFMSLLGTNALNHLVKTRGLHDPGLLLDALHQEIRTTLDQKNTMNRDGMDAAVVVIDRQKNEIQFAGAKNPLLLIRDGEVELIKGDRFSIGGRKDSHEKEYYQTHSFPIEEGLTAYIYSDGYQDQFGGPDNRKFLSRKFREMLVELHPTPMADQAELLAMRLAEWQGDHVQTDDILVMGLRL